MQQPQKGAQQRSAVRRAVAFGVLGLYGFLMVVFSIWGRIYFEDNIGVYVDVAVFALAFFCEWSVVVWADQARKFGTWILRQLWEKHQYWVEGVFFQNQEVWKDSSGVFDGHEVSRPGVWPSMSDNFATFGLYILKPRPFLVILVMLPAAMLMNMAQYGQDWYRHTAESLHLPPLDVARPEHLRVEIADVVFHPRASCEYLHFVPIPYSYNIAKVVSVSCLQDLLFGAGNLHKIKDDPLKIVPRCFSIFTICCVLNTWYNGVNRTRSGVFGTTVWEQYEGLLYYVNLQSSVSSLLLLTIKMFCETNVNEKGAPPGLGRLMDQRFWKLPSWKTDRERLFWIGVSVLSIGFAPLAVTHILPMTAAFILGILFPLWSPLLALFAGLSFFFRPPGFDIAPAEPSVWQDLWMRGAGMHCEAWQQAAVIGFMTLAGVLLRKWFWELHACFRWQKLQCQERYRLLEMAWWHQEESENNNDSDDSDTLEVTFTPGQAQAGEWMPLTPSRRRRHFSSFDDGEIELACEPQGPYGFNLACYQAFFSLPLLAYCNSMICAGVAVYSGARPLQEVFMADFTSRQVEPFNECIASSLVPLHARLESLITLL